jgi:hypothetical protein
MELTPSDQIGTVKVPAIATQADLLPRCKEVSVSVPAGTDIKGYTIRLDPEERISEFTRVNNRLNFKDKR